MAGLMDMFSSGGGGVPFLGSALNAAQGKFGAAAGGAIGSFFGPIGTFAGSYLGGLLDSHGGPKIESGYATANADKNILAGDNGASIMRTSNNPQAAKSIADTINGAYSSMLGRYGIQGDPLDLGVFTAFDPQGTANTQFGLTASLHGHELYNRGLAMNGVENVGRGGDEFKKALNEAAKNVLLPAFAEYGIGPNGERTMPQSSNNLQGGNMSLSDLFGGMNGGGTAAGSAGGNGIGSFFGGLGGMFGGGSGGGGFNLGQLTNLIPGLVDANQQNKASSTMIDFLGGQQQKMDAENQGGLGQLQQYLSGQQNTMNELNTKNVQDGIGWMNNRQNQIDQLYAPGTPEYNQLYDEMSRKDAAAGRNSQYGPRSTEFGAKLAGIRGNLMNQFTGAVVGPRMQGLESTGNQNLQFMNNANPLVARAMQQPSQQTLDFTTGTARALSDALSQRANRFSTLAGGLGANNPGGGTGSFGQGSTGFGAGGPAGSILDQLFGSGGRGLDGALNNISDTGFNSLTPSGSFAPNMSQSDSIFNQDFGFGNGGNGGLLSNTSDIFNNSNTMGDFGDLASDVFDWFL